MSGGMQIRAVQKRPPLFIETLGDVLLGRHLVHVFPVSLKIVR